VYTHVFLTSALVAGEWSASRPGRFTPVPIGWEAGWSPDPVDDMEKCKFLTPLGLELRSLGRPARSQSVYRLSYPGSSHSTFILRYVEVIVVSIYR
jgi:hypothetical protein